MRSIALRVIPIVFVAATALVGAQSALAIAPDTAPSGPIVIYQPGTTPCTPTTCRNYDVNPVVSTPFGHSKPGCDGYSYSPSCY